MLRSDVFSKCFEVCEVLVSSTFFPLWIAEMAVIDIWEARGHFSFVLFCFGFEENSAEEVTFSFV